jgi:hypothetical protein
VSTRLPRRALVSSPSPTGTSRRRRRSPMRHHMIASAYLSIRRPSVIIGVCAWSEISWGGERDVNERTSAGYASVGRWVGDPCVSLAVLGNVTPSEGVRTTFSQGANWSGDDPDRKGALSTPTVRGVHGLLRRPTGRPPGAPPPPRPGDL